MGVESQGTQSGRCLQPSFRKLYAAQAWDGWSAAKTQALPDGDVLKLPRGSFGGEEMWLWWVDGDRGGGQMRERGWWDGAA